MAISETKGQGWRLDSYPYPVKEGQKYINLNSGRLFVQKPPKRDSGCKCTAKTEAIRHE